MEWAVIREDRSGPEGILMILGNRGDAETIAAEVRQKGHKVKVLPYAGPGSAPRVDGGSGGRAVRRHPVILS